jgi:hypothetical protein
LSPTPRARRTFPFSTGRAILDKAARTTRRGRIDAIAEQAMTDYAGALERLGNSSVWATREGR